MLRPLFSKLFSQRIFAYPYSFLFGLLCGSLLALWLTAYVVSRKQYFQYRHVDNNFGQVITTMAAKHAMDATLNHDRLSLQILLKDISQYQAIINAAVYDVENELIVQAGIMGNEQNQYDIGYFNAPIALHDTIAGHVELAINMNRPKDISHIVLLIVVTGILASLAVFCLYKGMRTRRSENTEIKITTDGQAENKGAILLTLDIKNADAIDKGLNKKSRKNAVNQLYQYIQKALGLYNGAVVYVGSSAIVISFEQHGCEQNNAVFNAICCSYIIHQLSKKSNNFSLSLKTCVHHMPKSQEKLKLLHHNAADDTTDLIIESSLLKNRDVESRVLTSAGKHQMYFIEIYGFQKAYARLLDNQLNYLMATMTGFEKE